VVSGDALVGSRIAAAFRAAGLEPAPKPAPTRRRFWCLCPFHDDHHPSLDVANDWADHPGRWRCRACGERGDLVELAERRLGMSPEDALEWARGKGAFDEPQAPPPAAVEIELATRRAFRLPREVVIPEWVKGNSDAEYLARWPTPARRYLERRTLPAWQLARWELGFATSGRLAGRIVIPLFADNGEALVPVTYMARSFVDEEPRYLTPRPEEHPDLDALFGTAHWTEQLEEDEVVVTEGAFNGLAVERASAGACPTPIFFAAVGGASELRPAHAALIGRFARVCVLSDGDAAGDALADKLRGALGRHCEIRRVRLEHDADETPPAELARALWGAGAA
jgi:DNA primase